MATLEQLEEGIKRAHAAGNAEHVKALGQAYRQMQAQQATQPAPSSGPTPPPDARPGTPEYAAWAASEAQAGRGRSLPQVSDPRLAQTQSDILDPFVQGVTFGFADEMRGGVQGALAAAQGGDFGSVYDQTVDESRNALSHERAVNPVGSFAAELAGGIPTGMGLGGQLVGRGATLGARALTGAGVGAAQGAVYGAGSADENRLGGAAIGGLAGGVMGGAAPYIGNAIQSRLARGAQNRAIDAAIKDAPDAQTLRSSASNLFDSIRQTNTTVAPQKVRDFVTNAGTTLRNLGADRDITPQGVAVFRRMVEDLGGEISLPKLHVWRQLAGNAAMGTGGDIKMGNTLVRLIDDFIDTLKPGDLGFDPALFQGQSKSIPSAFFEAVSTYRRAAKMGTLEQAIAKAAEYQSGFESGLRNQFANILKSPTLSRGFTEAEKEAMRRVSRGTGGINLLRFVGGFGIPTDQARNWLGAIMSGSIGTAIGGVPGALALLGVGTAARAGSSKLIQNAADRAVRVVGTANIPSLPGVNRAIPSLPENVLRSLSGPVAGQLPAPPPGRPLRIVVDGANPIR